MAEPTQGRPNWKKVGLLAAAAVGVMLLLTARHGTSQVNFDHGGFGLPIPPVDAHYDGRVTLITCIWVGAVGLIALGSAVRHSLQKGVALPVLIVLSAPMVATTEVFVDVMGAVWFPVSRHDHVYTIMGRQMGWFPIIGWFGFAGASMYLIYRVLERGLSTKAIWLGFAAASLSATVIEEIWQAMGGMYVYYGHQPLIVLWKLPWWWTPCNAGGVFLAAAVAYRLRETLTGWRGLAMVAIAPASVAAAYGFNSLPSWIVVNGDYNWWTTQLGGLASIALGIVFIAGVIKIVVGRDPLDWADHDGAPVPAEEGKNPGPRLASGHRASHV
jgi:hypothetical protein